VNVGQPAAETENQTFELEIQELLSEEPLPVALKSTEKAAPVTEPILQTQPESVKEIAAPENSYGEDKELFADVETDKKAWWKIPAIALVFIILGGVGFGFWFSQAPKTVEPSGVSAETKNPSAENAKPAPPIETAPETSALPAVSASPETGEIPVGQSAVKSKSSQPATSAPRVEKRAAAPVKTTKEKKAVTVDDIINDN
jgi:hypothetical protein